MGSTWTREQEEELAELFERYQGDEGMYSQCIVFAYKRSFFLTNKNTLVM